MSSNNKNRLTKAERQSAAREKAKALREAQLKKEKRNKQILVWSIVGVVVAIGAVVALLVANSLNSAVPDAGPAPANQTQYGGVVFNKDGIVTSESVGEVNMANLPPALPAPTNAPDQKTEAQIEGMKVKEKGSKDPIQVIIYADAICPICKQFEDMNGAQLDKLVEEGKITTETRMVGLLDTYSQGSNYSSRAANMLACVANEAPEKYKDVANQIWAQQPAEQTTGLDNATLNAMAADQGVTNIESCVKDGTYRPWVKYQTQLATNTQVTGTPYVVVDGEYWDGPKDGQFLDFLNKKIDEKA